MNDKDRIIAELNRRMDAKDPLAYTNDDRIEDKAYMSIIDFIEKLSDTSASEDLEEEIENVADEFAQDDWAWDSNFDYIAHHFANWQKQQMINKACEWLLSNLGNYIGNYFSGKTEFVEDFRKAMEDEK